MVTGNLQLVTRNSCFSISRAGMLSKIIVVLKSSHRDAYFNRVVMELWLNYLKDICKRVQFLIKMHVIDLQLY